MRKTDRLIESKSKDGGYIMYQQKKCLQKQKQESMQ